MASAAISAARSGTSHVPSSASSGPFAPVPKVTSWRAFVQAFVGETEPTKG